MVSIVCLMLAAPIDLAKVDVGASALLSNTQTSRQQDLGGAASASVSASLWGAVERTRVLAALGVGWLGFPAREQGPAAGIGFLTLGPSVALPVTGGGDYLLVEARAGAGRTGPLTRPVIDLSASFNFRWGRWSLGPGFRYVQVLDGEGGSEGDAKIAIGGASLGWVIDDEPPVRREVSTPIASREPTPEPTQAVLAEEPAAEAAQRPADKIAERIAIVGGIIFAPNKDTIRGQESQDVLDQIARKMSTNRALRVRVAVYTDERPSADQNLRLSASRAESVRLALVKRGVPEDRLEAVGYGDTGSGQRVDFTILP